jgi:hypothetical protein
LGRARALDDPPQARTKIARGRAPQSNHGSQLTDCSQPPPYPYLITTTQHNHPPPTPRPSTNSDSNHAATMNLPRVAALLAGLATVAVAAELPACPVAIMLKAPVHPVTAGRRAAIKLDVKAMGGELGSGQHNFSVAINLPSDVCLKKSSVRPSLKRNTSPTPKAPVVEGQNVYWLDVPFAGGTKEAPRRRLFSLAVRVSSLYTIAATVPVTAMVYAVDDDTGAATCVTTSKPAASVRCVCVYVLGEGGWGPFLWRGRNE